MLYVKILAKSVVDWRVAEEFGFIPYDQVVPNPAADAPDDEWAEWQAAAFPTSIDGLHEISGRACYESFHRPNPETQTNRAYLRKSILDNGHYSVVAHGHVTFAVRGVSRALLLELERHSKRSHHNFSVKSQRYVPHGQGSAARVVTPPLFDEDQAKRLEEAFLRAQDEYDRAYNELRDKGCTPKAARGAARAFLPENTETSFVVTASIRGWREVLEQRLDKAADEEIRRFAVEVLRELIRVAPNSVQDFAEQYAGMVGV